MTSPKPKSKSKKTNNNKNNKKASTSTPKSTTTTKSTKNSKSSKAKSTAASSKTTKPAKCTSTSSSNTTSKPSSTSAKTAVPPIAAKSSKKPATAVSKKSTSSEESIASVGIGAPGRLRQPAPNAELRFRLMPEGCGNNVMNIYEHTVFDCLVFVMVCERHKTVALTNTNRLFSWFPFIPLADVFTWNRISRDGLAIMLGKNDSNEEVDQTMAVVPEYEVHWLNFFRLQMPKTNKFFTRITQLLKLEGEEDDKCCQTTSNLRWVKLSQINRRAPELGNLWGDEVVSVCRAICLEERTFLTEYDLASHYPKADDSWEALLLKEVKWPVERVHDLLEDYAAHMYPAFTMTINSFRTFMQKHSCLPKDCDQKLVNKLFRAFAQGKESINFTQLAFGLAAMDPLASNRLDFRIKFIFHYYDPENTSILTQSQLTEIFRDIEPSSSRTDLELFASSLICKYSVDRGLNMTQFTNSLRRIENEVPNAERLLRLERSFFELRRIRPEKISGIILPEAKGGNDSGSTKTKEEPKSKSKSQSKDVLCSNHVKKKYDYGLHAVQIDSSGRCVDPRIISEHWVKQWADTEMSRHRYSVENIFRINSIVNIFLDLVKDFRANQPNEPDCRGLLTAEEDWETLHLYLEMLVHQVTAILKTEPKVLRLAGPIYIFGDLLGSLSDLFKFESHLFRGTAVISHTLLFLGNYTGASFPYGLECIVYLLALKIFSPNKIYLLRGRHELRSFNRGHFRTELHDKYGPMYGEKIYEQINRVYDFLPVAAVIEESVFCTHSGIPKLKADKKPVSVIDSFSANKIVEMSDPKEMMPIAYEMIINVPIKYSDKSEIDDSAKKGDGFLPSKLGDHFFFTRKAFETFMAANHFDYFIRSHNPCDEGYALCYSNRCLTVFSCRKSNKQSLSNTCFVSLSDAKKKIRFIRLRTKDGDRITSRVERPNRRPDLSLASKPK